MRSRGVLRPQGRILWLTEDPALVARQIAGEDLEARADAHPPLRYGVSTDLVVDGAACTLGYTPEVLGPHFLKGLAGEDAIRRAGFSVLVAGHAYGSGSSREVAVDAHRGAGIELVVAESLSRIFQENLIYAGLPFTTDLSVVDALRAGGSIPEAELTAGLPPFFRAVADAGGLLPLGARLMVGETSLSAPSHPGRPMTLAEKLIAENRAPEGGTGPVRPGDQVLCRTGFRGLHEYTAGMVASAYEAAFGDAPVVAPERVACFEDHFNLLEDPDTPGRVRAARLGPARRLAEEMRDACRRHGIPLHGPGRALDAGVCHRLVLERYAEPGTVVVLTDSHTPTAGVLGTFAFGVGSTAMAFALRTGWVPVTVPSTVRVEVEGPAEGGLSPKDLILHLIGDPWFREERWRRSSTDTCVLELAGAGLDQWDVDELSVLTNMTVEGGLMTGVMVETAPARRFLEAQGRGPGRWLAPDPGAEYARVIRVDLSEVPLTVATPGDARNRASLDDHAGTPIQNVVIASCTGGSLADLRAAAAVLRGRRLAPEVRLTVTPASAAVAEAAQREGLLEVFSTLGAHVSAPGCGACIGNGPGVPRPGETTASTTNRNFEGRMGAPGPVFLVSPAVAAACAATGRLSDPRRI